MSRVKAGDEEEGGGLRVRGGAKSPIDRTGS